MMHNGSVKARAGRAALAAWAILAAGSYATAAEAPAGAGLQAGDNVAVIGDSITEQRQYSVFMEDYLLMCQPKTNLHAVQFGWGGETSWGFAARMANDLFRFKPTAATTCYGMNDGGYSPMSDGKARQYHDAQTDIVKRMKAAGVRAIVVGSPGAVDTDFFRRDAHNPQQAAEASAMYNKTLAALGDIAKQVAREQGVAFADVHTPMMEAMAKAKAKYGPEYSVCGGDGVHPDANGHLVMAYALLKGLGCDGNIGTITVDLAANKAEATEGHKVLGVENGTVEIESARYPFCFTGDPKSSGSTRGIIEFIPFNEDLNRFMLVVKGAPSAGGKVKVTWGGASREFAAGDLAKGINLASEFAGAEGHPFAQAFQAVDAKVKEQQGFETPLIKSLIHNLPEYEQAVPEEKESLARIADGLLKKHHALVDASSGALKPVKHTIKIEAVK